MIEVVHKGFDNPNTITIEEDGAPIDFSAVTRMVLSFEGSTVVADTDIGPTLIDWSQGNGVVEFNLNDLALTGEYPATLVAYDPTHTGGQVLLSASNTTALSHEIHDRSLKFIFIDV